MSVENFIEFWKIPGLTALLTAGLGLWGNNWLTARRDERVNQLALGKEERARNEDLRYQALRVALSLEKFSIACAGIVSDTNIFDESNGTAGQRYTALPEISITEAVQWKLFEIDITNEILSFENTIADGNNSISFQLHIGGSYDVTEEAELQAGLCGYIAHKIAEKLRRRYDLGKRRPPVHGWDYVEQLQAMHDLKLASYIAAREHADL